MGPAFIGASAKTTREPSQGSGAVRYWPDKHSGARDKSRWIRNEWPPPHILGLETSGAGRYIFFISSAMICGNAGVCRLKGRIT